MAGMRNMDRWWYDRLEAWRRGVAEHRILIGFDEWMNEGRGAGERLRLPDRELDIWRQIGARPAGPREGGE